MIQSRYSQDTGMIQSRYSQDTGIIQSRYSQDTVRFKSRANKQRHMDSVHGVKNFRCHICKKQYSRKDVLRNHLKIHSKKKVVENPFYIEGGDVGEKDEELNENPFFIDEDGYEIMK